MTDEVWVIDSSSIIWIKQNSTRVECARILRELDALVAAGQLLFPKASLAASPSNSLESPCQKARSRLPAVFRPAVSTVREVSAGSASRARPPTDIVARHAGCHPATQNRRRIRRLPAPSTREREACLGAPQRSTRWFATISRRCSARSTMGRLRSASLSMPGRNSWPTSTAGSSVAALPD